MSTDAQLVAKSADALQITSRNFYENTLFKSFLAICYSAAAIFLLGMCSKAGGQSRAAYYNQKSVNDNDVRNGLQSYITGYGFASFFFFCAFAIMLGAAFHISPIVNGSANEKRTLKTPVDLER